MKQGEGESVLREAFRVWLTLKRIRELDAIRFARLNDESDWRTRLRNAADREEGK
jgi:hypothetical protein